MKGGALLFVIADVKDYLVANGKLKDDGSLDFSDANTDIGLAAVIDNSLKKHGVDVPNQVDRIIQALPLIIAIFVH